VIADGLPRPVPSCVEPGCDEPRWTTTRRGTTVVVSERCFAHSNVALFDLPTESKPKPKPEPTERLRDDKGNALSTFHSEVRRQRLERER
jgi:hypothetical protein